MIHEKQAAPKPLLLEGFAFLLAIPMAALALLLAAGCASTEGGEKPAPAGPGWWNLDLDEGSGISGGNPSGPLKEDAKKNWKKEMDFLSALAGEEVVSMKDAVTALTLFEGESPWAEEVSLLASRLEKRGVVLEKWRIAPDEPLTMGRIAYMICRACRVRGGIWMALFGPSERYCFKEAVYLELIPPGSLHHYVSGGELLNILSQARLYVEEREGGQGEG